MKTLENYKRVTRKPGEVGLIYRGTFNFSMKFLHRDKEFDGN